MSDQPYQNNENPEVVVSPPAADAPSDWKESLPDDLKADPSLVAFKDVETLAKSFIHNKKYLNDRGILIPREDAPPEKWDEYYKALGRPDDPEKYQFTEIKLPEGQEVDADMEKNFREQAFAAGLTAKQAGALRDWYFNQATERIGSFEQQQKEALGAATETLKKTWGNKFETNIKSADSAWRKFVAPEDMEATIAMMDQGPGNNPLFIKLFHNIAKSMGEDTLKGSDGIVGKGHYEQALDIMRTPEYTDANHPGHKDAVKKAEVLFGKAFPDSEK